MIYGNFSLFFDIKLLFTNESCSLFFFYNCRCFSFLFFISIPLCRRLYLAGKRYGKRTAFVYGGYHLDSPVHVFHDGLADG